MKLSSKIECSSKIEKKISYCPNDPKLKIHFGNLAEDPSVLFSVAKSEF